MDMNKLKSEKRDEIRNFIAIKYVFYRKLKKGW